MGFICRYCDIIPAIQLNDIVKSGLQNRICMNMVLCPLTPHNKVVSPSYWLPCSRKCV